MSTGRDKRKQAKRKRELYRRPAKAVIRKVAKKIIDTLEDK